MKTMRDNGSGKTMNVLLLDGLSEILEVGELSQALKMAVMLNQNSDSNWHYSVRGGGKIYEKELQKLTHYRGKTK